MRSLATGVVLVMAMAAPSVAGPDQPPARRPAPRTPPGPAASLETTARATLDRWLATQNQGDFDGYAALYAPTFEGIKRVGKTTKKMARAAWLADRKGMFKAPMTVAANDVAIVLPGPAAPAGPVITLTQRWTQGSFADLGPKRLVLSADGRLIVAEEMLSSRVLLTEDACLTALYPGASPKRRLTGEDDGKRRVVAVQVLDLGKRAACKVEVAGDGVINVAVAVLGRGRRWAVSGRIELDYPDVPEDDSGTAENGEVTLGTVAMHTSIPVLVVTRKVHSAGPQYSDTTTTTTLYRTDGAKLVELLGFESKSSAGEADSGRDCVLAVGKTRRQGWLDVAVGCTTSEQNWQTGESSETTETTRYRWDGTGYAVR